MNTDTMTFVYGRSAIYVHLHEPSVEESSRLDYI